MAMYGKAATLILASLPVAAMAQSTPVRSATQPRPAAPARMAPGSARTMPNPAAPDSRRLVTNENSHPAPRPQPNPQAPGNVVFQPAPATRSVPVMQPVILPVTPQAPPAAAYNPDAQSPQLPQVQPVVITNSTAAPAGQEARAAVDYISGQLTVVAENAPLSSVLKLIAAKTGAVIDMAPELQNEPVMAHLGPDSVQEVLTGLLNSPRIDYIVFGTGDEPGSLQRIVVRTRRSFGHVALAAIPQYQTRPGQPAENASEEIKLDNDLNVPAQAKQSEEERMKNWRRIREEMRQAEIKQQAEEREREKTQPPEPPAPQNNPPAETQQDNPPS